MSPVSLRVGSVRRHIEIVFPILELWPRYTAVQPGHVVFDFRV